MLQPADVLADMPRKRCVDHALPMLPTRGDNGWRHTTEFDCDGILDRHAHGPMDVVESIVRACLAKGVRCGARHPMTHRTKT